MRCRERCIGGDYGGHHPSCPESYGCQRCGGPVDPDQWMCEACSEEERFHEESRWILVRDYDGKDS